MLKAWNAIIGTLVGKFGLNFGGAKVLTVRGRSTGQPHSVPINPFEVEGHPYLLSPRGETQWVRNLRAAGEGTLGKGGRDTHFTVVDEVPDDTKPPIIAAYLERWHRQVGKIMNVDKSPSEDRLREIAPSHPVFRIAMEEMAGPAGSADAE